jgi:hypothetical protein
LLSRLPVTLPACSAPVAGVGGQAWQSLTGSVNAFSAGMAQN